MNLVAVRLRRLKELLDLLQAPPTLGLDELLLLRLPLGIRVPCIPGNAMFQQFPLLIGVVSVDVLAPELRIGAAVEIGLLCGDVAVGKGRRSR